MYYFGGDSRSPIIGFFCQGIFGSCLTFHSPNIRIITDVPAELFSGEMVISVRSTKWPLKSDFQNDGGCSVVGGTRNFSG